MPSLATFGIGAVAAVVAVLYGPVSQRITTVGGYRSMSTMKNVHGHELKIIPNTIQCEDVHHHIESGLLFTACQGENNSRNGWFPGLGKLEDPKAPQIGQLVVVDPRTFTATNLKLEGFSGPFVTHGIDILTDPNNSSLLHIFAVNHLPNNLHFKADGSRNETQMKAASQIEIFTHVLGSKTAQWQRSVRSSLITTPNDIYATSPATFYVTNDHYYPEGIGRTVEDALTAYTAPWSNIAYVMIHEPQGKVPTEGIFALNAFHGLHNNNGLGRSSPSRPDEVLITDASGGVLYRAQRASKGAGVKVIESMQYDSCIDNPSWYDDPYKTATDDASGHINAGLAMALELAHYTVRDVLQPCLVWYARARNVNEIGAEKHDKWEKRLIFADNGTIARTASSAVIVGIDPKTTGGQKQGWLFVTGFLSDNMVAAKIDL